MSTVIIGDDEAVAGRVRAALEKAGIDCPAEHLVGTAGSERLVAKLKPKLVVVVAGSDPGAAASVVTRSKASGRVILAVGPVEDSRVVLKVLRAGADDFIDQREPEGELRYALARFESQRRGHGPGRMISVVAACGGTGCSLIAANLAVALAKTHESSVVVDLKPRCGDLAAMLDLKPTHTMLDLCRMVDRVDATVLKQIEVRHDCGVSLIAAPRGYAGGYPPADDSLPTIYEIARLNGRPVVIDVDPALPQSALDTLRQSDSIVVATRLEFNALRNTKELIEHLRNQGIDGGKIALVGNRHGRPREVPAAAMTEALGRGFAALLPEDPKPALASINNGRPVILEYPRSRLSKKLLELAKILDARPTAKGSAPKSQAAIPRGSVAGPSKASVLQGLMQRPKGA